MNTLTLIIEKTTIIFIMSKIEDYQKELLETTDWEAYLMAESNLPGPRGNIELGKAVAMCGSEQQFLALIKWTADIAPENTPQSFLSFLRNNRIGKADCERG